MQQTAQNDVKSSETVIWNAQVSRISNCGDFGPRYLGYSFILVSFFLSVPNFYIEFKIKVRQSCLNWPTWTIFLSLE
jgi:hypothetical protein